MQLKESENSGRARRAYLCFCEEQTAEETAVEVVTNLDRIGTCTLFVTLRLSEFVKLNSQVDKKSDNKWWR